MTDAAAPRFVQVLATTNGPEGLLVVPQRDLLVVSSEEDDAAAGVRSAVTVFGRGDAWADAAGSPRFPSVVSADATTGPQAGAPIGWGALGALSADPTDPQRLWTATDAAYSPTQLLSLDVRGDGEGSPAVIDRTVTVTRDGAPVGLDVEGSRRAPGRVLARCRGREGREGREGRGERDRARRRRGRGRRVRRASRRRRRGPREAGHRGCRGRCAGRCGRTRARGPGRGRAGVGRPPARPDDGRGRHGGHRADRALRRRDAHVGLVRLPARAHHDGRRLAGAERGDRRRPRHARRDRARQAQRPRRRGEARVRGRRPGRRRRRGVDHPGPRDEDARARRAARPACHERLDAGEARGPHGRRRRHGLGDHGQRRPGRRDRRDGAAEPRRGVRRVRRPPRRRDAGRPG